MTSNGFEFKGYTFAAHPEAWDPGLKPWPTREEAEAHACFEEFLTAKVYVSKRMTSPKTADITYRFTEVEIYPPSKHKEAP